MQGALHCMEALLGRHLGGESDLHRADWRAKPPLDRSQLRLLERDYPRRKAVLTEPRRKAVLTEPRPVKRITTTPDLCALQSELRVQLRQSEQENQQWTKTSMESRLGRGAVRGASRKDLSANLRDLHFSNNDKSRLELHVELMSQSRLKFDMGERFSHVQEEVQRLEVLPGHHFGEGRLELRRADSTSQEPRQCPDLFVVRAQLRSQLRSD